MLKPKPERISYAQQKLIELIEQRKLREWCANNGIEHTGAYRIALSNQLPTYRLIGSMCHAISPIEWLFFTDEKLPYEPELLPKWTCERPCKYVEEHHYDYKTIAKKYNLDLTNARNIFFNYTALPTPMFIRQVCKDVNPIEFFMSAEDDNTLKLRKEYIPGRGDIIEVQQKKLFVISKQEDNQKNQCYSGCLILPEKQEGQNATELTGTYTQGFVIPNKLLSFDISFNRAKLLIELIEKASPELTEKVISEVRKILL